MFFKYTAYCGYTLSILTLIYCFYNLGYATNSSSESGTGQTKWKQYLYSEDKFEQLNHTDKFLSLVTVLTIFYMKAKFVNKAKTME
jgi:hypothetical protein